MDEQGFVELIVKKLVDFPEEVNIKRVEGERSVILEVRVNAKDIGKVIGKGGRIVSAIRSLLYAMSRKSEKKIMLEVIE